MPGYPGYSIAIIVPGLVEIHEDVDVYRLTEADILAALEHVKSHRSSYATDVAYLKRVSFYEEALQTARGRQEGKS